MLFIIWIFRMLTCCSQVTSQAPGKTLLDYNEDFFTREPKSNTTWMDCKCTRCEEDDMAWDVGIYENVAFNANVTSTSQLNPRHPACAVTNGVRSLDSNITGAQCFHADTNDRYSWVLVDLSGVFTFREIRIFPWTDKVDRYYGRRIWGAIEISVDGVVIRSFQANHQRDLLGEYEFNLTLSGNANGQYVRLEKVHIHIENEYSSFGLCSLEIYVCKIGTYGIYFGRSCLPCPTNCDYSCNNMLGCRRMTHNVAFMKRAHQSHTTDVDPGRVVSGLNNEVPGRSYLIINANNVDDWVWSNVFLGGYYRIHRVSVIIYHPCGDPMREFYVTSTNSSSLANLPPRSGQTCKFQQGNVPNSTVLPCSHQIIAQFAWILSQEKLCFDHFRVFGYAVYFLPLGSYCRPTSKYMFCAPPGMCLNGVCRCEPGRYGKYCSKPCSPGCQNITCDWQNGKCSPCKEDFTGDTCSDCTPGLYGDNCSMPCSPGCPHVTCGKQNGTCYPCSEGFIGDMCSECALGYYTANQTNRDTQTEHYKANRTNNDTQTGYYKANLTNNDTQMGNKANLTNQASHITNDTCQPCSEGCDDERLCDANGGRCNGCDEGLYGAFCELNCTARCKHCDQDDGVCTLCRDNLKPPNCTDCIGGYLFKGPDIIACVRCLGICRPGTVCNQTTGFCAFCSPGRKGNYCEIGPVSLIQKTLVIGSPVAASAAAGYAIYRYITHMRHKAVRACEAAGTAMDVAGTLKRAGPKVDASDSSSGEHVLAVSSLSSSTSASISEN